MLLYYKCKVMIKKAVKIILGVVSLSIMTSTGVFGAGEKTDFVTAYDGEENNLQSSEMNSKIAKKVSNGLKNEQNEQLVENNLLTGEETVINIPAVTTFSNSDGDTAASFGNAESEISAQSVYGKDNRTVISNTTSSPYYGIAYLNVTFTNNKTYRGTAFMISQNVMLTAGHNLYKSGYKVKSIVIYPGRSGDYIPKKVTATKFYLDTKYTGTQPDWDYGIIVLNSNIRKTTGWFGLHATSDAKSIGIQKVTVTGYPSDLAGRKMWRDVGTVSSVTSNRFKHNADTYKGNSGSPSYAYSSTYGYQVYGIHTNGGNYSRRITKSLFDWLKNNGFIR